MGYGSFFGYGSVGAARAVEQLRQIAAELQMAPMSTGVHIQGADFFGAWQQGAALKDMGHLQPGVQSMLYRFRSINYEVTADPTGRRRAQPPIRKPRPSLSIWPYTDSEYIS